MYFIALMCFEEFQMQGRAKSLRGLNVDIALLPLIMIYIFFPCDCFILDKKKEIIKEYIYQRISSFKIEQKSWNLFFVNILGVVFHVILWFRKTKLTQFTCLQSFDVATPLSLDWRGVTRDPWVKMMFSDIHWVKDGVEERCGQMIWGW